MSEKKLFRVALTLKLWTNIMDIATESCVSFFCIRNGIKCSITNEIVVVAFKKNFKINFRELDTANKDTLRFEWREWMKMNFIFSKDCLLFRLSKLRNLRLDSCSIIISLFYVDFCLPNWIWSMKLIEIFAGMTEVWTNKLIFKLQFFAISKIFHSMKIILTKCKRTTLTINNIYATESINQSKKINKKKYIFSNQGVEL